MEERIGRRVMVIGGNGAGKTEFSKKLASLTGLKADLSASIAIVFRVTLWGMGWGLYPAFKASGISVMAAIRLKTGR